MAKLLMASALALAATGISTGVAVADPVPSVAPTDQAAFEKRLHKRTGDVVVPGTDATLHLGSKYYFLDAGEAKDVLVKLWGNPPSSADDVLGIVMPADKTVLDNSWGAVITWDGSGYVTDDDAATANYDKVLDDIRAGEADDNAQRQKSGYPAMHVVGWAQPPSYDKASHSLVWARDIKFGNAPVDGLNYDVRSLGRHGVLSLNMLWDMSHLADTRTAAAELGKAVAFDKGAAYTDYDKSVDKTAEYGLAGLVAAGAGIVVAKKLGLLAIMFGFGKWILIGLAAVGATMRRWIGKIFNRSRDTLEG